MANNTWKNYTQKSTALSDNDEVMLLDSTDEKNKRGLMSKFWDYVVDKMATAVISKLETNNKTIIGAINALNGKSNLTINNIGRIATIPAKSYVDFDQKNDTSSETFYKNLLKYMKENGFQSDSRIYISLQNPNGWDLILGIYFTNNYAGFIAIQYGAGRIDLFGLENGNYYFKNI